MPSRGDARADAEVGSIVGPAWSWRWQAPELALVFGERALRTADQRGDQLAGLWAQTLVVSASCRLGQQLAVTDKAIDALRLSERLADDAAGAILRVELAGCARSAGVPLVGAGLLRPVLSAADIRPAVRAAALIQLAGCLAYSERHRELDAALGEADQLYADDPELDHDARLGLRAVLRSFVAREHRRRGDLRSALHAAEEGADLLGGLNDLSADGGAAARICLQQVLGLLDLGWVDQAATVAAGALSGPVRAHSAAAVGWLALAISTRVQLPAGLIEPAIALLQEIASMAERHHRDALHAETLSALSEAHELAGELAETLDYLRSAQVIRARRSRALRAARSALLSAFGEARNPDDLLRLLNPTVSTGGRRAADRDRPLFGQRADTGQPDASGITMVLIDVAKNRSGMAPAARGPVTSGSLGPGAAGIGTWTAESLGAGSRIGDPIGEGVLRKVVEHLRDLTPAEAALARVGGAELAVLLPGTSRSQVERWAEELRAAMANVDWSQVTPGLTVNVRTMDTEDERDADKTAPQQRAARPANAPASGIALDAGPTRSRRTGELTSPRLPIPPQPTEPERSSALAADQPVPPARAPEQPSGRRARGTLPVEQATPEPARTPLPQASLSGLFPPPPEPTPDPEEAARRRHAASQEPTERWTPVWLPADEESSGRWVLDPSEAKPAEPLPSEGLDRFGLGGLAGGGRRRSEEAQPATRASHRSPEPTGQSTSDTERRRAEETPVAEAGSRHSAPPNVSARSVLDSLGISGGSGGGRRRAPEAPDTLAPQEPPRPQPASADSEPTGRRARRDYSQPLAGLIPAVEPSSGGRRRAEDTIPKIRLPQLPIPPQPSTPDQPRPPAPGSLGFPGAAFPGSGFSGLNPTAMPSRADDDLTPPSGFALPTGLTSAPPASGLTPPPTLTPPAAPSYEPTPYVAIPPASTTPPSGAAAMDTPAASPASSDPAPSSTAPGSTPLPGTRLPGTPLSSLPGSPAPSSPAPINTASGRTASSSAASGGAASGGAASGGAASGGTASGGTASGGTASGGTASGGTASGGTASGGTASGGAASASFVPGGTAPGSFVSDSSAPSSAPSSFVPGGAASGGFVPGSFVPGPAPTEPVEPTPPSTPFPAEPGSRGPGFSAEPAPHGFGFAAEPPLPGSGFSAGPSWGGSAFSDSASAEAGAKSFGAAAQTPARGAFAEPDAFGSGREEGAASGRTGSGAAASGAMASGAMASGAMASGAMASGAMASGAMASGATTSEAVSGVAGAASVAGSGQPEGAFGERGLSGSGFADPAPPSVTSPAAQFSAGFNSGASSSAAHSGIDFLEAGASRGSGAGVAADDGSASRDVEPVSRHGAPVEPAAPEPGESTEGGSSFSALSEFSAMLARFDDPAPSAIELPEPSTTPLKPESPSETAALPEPEVTPPSRAEPSAAAQPFAPETMFGGSSVGGSSVGGSSVGGSNEGSQAEKPADPPSKEPLRPTPPPTGIAAKLAGPDTDSDVASIEGRSARGRRRSPKLGDLLTEALRAYQDVRDADEANDALAASEPSELGATELGSWLGTGTEPIGSIEPSSWRPGSSTRSFGVARHGSGDEGDSRGLDWNPPGS